MTVQMHHQEQKIIIDSNFNLCTKTPLKSLFEDSKTKQVKQETTIWYSVSLQKTLINSTKQKEKMDGLTSWLESLRKQGSPI